MRIELVVTDMWRIEAKTDKCPVVLRTPLAKDAYAIYSRLVRHNTYKSGVLYKNNIAIARFDKRIR